MDREPPDDDEATFTLDCTFISPYLEPERYEAARVEADRQFEKLVRMLKRFRGGPTE